MSIFSETSKRCKTCETIKDKTEFYRAGPSYQANCKPCHNKLRPTYARTIHHKGSGFKKLTVDQQKKILHGIQIEGKKLKIVAQENNIKYHSILYWKKKGYFNLPKTELIGDVLQEVLPQ